MQVQRRQQQLLLQSSKGFESTIRILLSYFEPLNNLARCTAVPNAALRGPPIIDIKQKHTHNTNNEENKQQKQHGKNNQNDTYVCHEQISIMQYIYIDRTEENSTNTIDRNYTYHHVVVICALTQITNHPVILLLVVQLTIDQHQTSAERNCLHSLFLTH